MADLTDIVKDIEDTSNTNRVHKVASVRTLATSGLVAGQAVELIGYHEDTTVGGGSGVITTARHNGGTAISLARVFPTDWTDQSQLTTWFADSGSDELCFVRNYSGNVDVKWFGATSDSDTLVINHVSGLFDNVLGFGVNSNLYNKKTIDDILLDYKDLSNKIRSIPEDFTTMQFPKVTGKTNGVVPFDLKSIFENIFTGLYSSTNIRYVDPINGSDSNAGLTRTFPWKTIQKALTSTGADIIHLMSGKHYGSSWSVTRTPSNAVRFMIGHGDCRIYGGEPYSDSDFSASGALNTYEITFITDDPVVAILDETDYREDPEFPERMPERDNVADVTTLSYGWHYDELTKTLTIRYGTHTPADFIDKIDIIFGVSGVTVGNPFGTLPRVIDQGLYIDNVDFYGTGLRNICTLDDGRSHLFAKNVRYLYSRYKSFHSDGGVTWNQKCDSYDSEQDGFSYYSAGTSDGFGIEEDCTSVLAGATNRWETGVYNKNASTTHNNFKLLRIGGIYDQSAGPVIADTGPDSKSYNINSYVGSCIKIGTAPALGSIYSSVEMWLDQCYVSNSGDVDLVADGGIIHTYKTSYATKSENNGGVVTDFLP